MKKQKAKSKGRPKGSKNEDTTHFNSEVELPAKTLRFTIIQNSDVVRKLFKETKIKIPSDSSVYGWTFKDKFVFGYGILGNKNEAGDWVSTYKWFVIDRETMALEKEFKGEKLAGADKGEYDKKNINCATFLQRKLEELY